MITRPQSREGYTSFPIANTTLSSATSERLGAFGTMNLEEPVSYGQPRSPSNHYRSHSQPQSSFPSQIETQPAQYREEPGSRHSWRHSNSPARRPQQPSPAVRYDPVRTENNHQQGVYHSTVSNADTTETRRKYDKLSEVYSTSGDTVEFARNLGEYINDKIPYAITISILIALCIIAFVFALIGTLNIPFCPVQPMIPIWLIVGGALFIISAVFRIFSAIPTRPVRLEQRNLSADLCVKVTEIGFILANIVWLILGCVWVYGSKSYVHFEDQMFQEHYCDPGLYWTAFAAATGYLVFVCLLILSVICLLAVGSYKETETSSNSHELISQR